MCHEIEPNQSDPEWLCLLGPMQKMIPLIQIIESSLFKFYSMKLKYSAFKQKQFCVLLLYSHIINMHIYTYACRIHIDAIIKTSEDFFKKIYLSLWKVACERELETEQNCNILIPTLMAISVVSFSFSRAAQPEAREPTLLGAVFLYHILSSKLVSKLTNFLSSPSYIIVQSPTQYLWNGMFVRHQVEITVMQFTGHSLPVHQSMTVPWDFTLSHIVSQTRLHDFFP